MAPERPGKPEKSKGFQKRCSVRPAGRRRHFPTNGEVQEQVIRFCCPRCSTRCVTPEDYEKHLISQKHKKALERRFLYIEGQLNLKRKEQKQAQIVADKLLGITSSVVKYCEICDVEFHQEESNHVASKLHIALEKLVKPVCKICSYIATSAEEYEKHICSLEHLKNEEIVLHEESDSVNNESGGASVLQRVEVYKCKVCNRYLPHEGNQEIIRQKHENSVEHMLNYVKYFGGN